GWMNPQHASIYNFLIMTPNHKEFLYALRDLSHISHTADLLFNEIEKILIKIGPEKFIGVISDNALAIVATHKQINQKYPSIINLRCIVHFVNLISHDILKCKLSAQLSYNVKNKTEDELVALIQRSYLFDAEDKNDISEDYKDENNGESDDDLEIPNHQVVVLVINNVVDLHHQAFNQVGDLYISNEDNINSDVAMNEDHEFNLEEL
ncbi:13264_t:CDS:2, partial [Cetraspora pellucida]